MDKVIDRGGFALSAGESLDNYIKVTELQRATAQSALDELLRGPTPNQLRVANARITLANAEVDAAQARLNLLQAGPLSQDVAVAQAKVDQAKADEAAVQTQIDQTKLVAPFDGLIANVAVDVNQFVGPGQPIVQLADLTSLRVETTDLDEKDVARLNVGDQRQCHFRRAARHGSQRHDHASRPQGERRHRREFHRRHRTRSNSRSSAVGHDGQCRAHAHRISYGGTIVWDTRGEDQRQWQSCADCRRRCSVLECPDN